MAGTINDILLNCTETLTVVSKTTDGGSNAAFILVGYSDQIQVGMTIGGLANPNGYAEGADGVLVKEIEKGEATYQGSNNSLKVTFGRATDNSAGSYTIAGDSNVTFTNEGPTPTTRTSGSSSLIDNSFVNTGVPGDKSTFVKKFTADTNHVFKTPPVISLKGCSNPNNYTVAIVDTKNSSGFLTAREFTVTVKIDKNSSTDSIEFNAKAEAGFNPSVNEINNFTLNTNTLPWTGGTRTLSVSGDVGAKFKLKIQQSVGSAAFSDKLAIATYVIPEGGVYTKNIRFGKITTNTYFLITISVGDDTSTFVGLESPEVVGIHQVLPPTIRAYSQIGGLTANGQGAWSVTGNHLTANANQITGLAMHSSSSLGFKVTASNTTKFVQYNSTGTSGFTHLNASTFKSSKSFGSGDASATDTRLIAYASATDNPAQAWSKYSGGAANSTSGSVGQNVARLAPVYGRQRTFMTRNFDTTGKPELLVATGAFNNTAQWDKQNGVDAWTADATDLNPKTVAGFIAGKLNSPYLEEGKTYALTYTISGADGVNTNLVIPETDAAGADVPLPTSIGTHTVYWTQGDEHNGMAIGGTGGSGALENDASATNGQWLKFALRDTNGNASMAIDDISLKTVAFDDHIVTGTTAVKLWNGTQPENFTVELTAVEPRLLKNMEVRGVGVNAGTYIKTVDGKYITLSSSPASAIAKGVTLSFYQPATIIETSDLKFKMTQGTDNSGGDSASKVEVEGSLAISSVGAYDVDIDLDLGVFIEADTVSLPSA